MMMMMMIFTSKIHCLRANHVAMTKARGLLVNARLPGRAQLAKAPPPGLIRRANSPQGWRSWCIKRVYGT